MRRLAPVAAVALCVAGLAAQGAGPGPSDGGTLMDFDAGKYAIYVWPAFGITASAFAWMIVDSLAMARRWKRELERRQAELDEKKN